MVIFHHNFFNGIYISKYLGKEASGLSDSFIQILLTNSIINYYNKYNLNGLGALATKVRAFFKGNLRDCYKKVILYRSYSTETIPLESKDPMGNKVPVFKGLYDIWVEKEINYAELTGGEFDPGEKLSPDKLFDCKYFCLCENQDVYDGYFVYIDMRYLAKLINIK